MNDSLFSPVVLSLKVSFFATLINIFLGSTISYFLAKKDFWGKNFVDAIIMQPLIMPPTVLGYYLLTLLGRQGVIGSFTEDVLGFSLVFNLPAAIIAASVASLPLFIKPARTAIESINPHIENSARLLGKNEREVFFSVTLPLAKMGIIAGTALTFARSLGEFGTTLMIAGNIPGKTQTLSIAIYDAVQAGNSGMANFLVLLTTVISVTVLFIVNKSVTQKY